MVFEDINFKEIEKYANNNDIESLEKIVNVFKNDILNHIDDIDYGDINLITHKKNRKCYDKIIIKYDEYTENKLNLLEMIRRKINSEEIQKIINIDNLFIELNISKYHYRYKDFQKPFFYNNNLENKIFIKIIKVLKCLTINNDIILDELYISTNNIKKIVGKYTTFYYIDGEIDLLNLRIRTFKESNKKIKML